MAITGYTAIVVSCTHNHHTDFAWPLNSAVLARYARTLALQKPPKSNHVVETPLTPYIHPHSLHFDQRNHYAERS